VTGHALKYAITGLHRRVKHSGQVHGIVQDPKNVDRPPLLVADAKNNEVPATAPDMRGSSRRERCRRGI
jgi:hypothetical protein